MGKPRQPLDAEPNLTMKTTNLEPTRQLGNGAFNIQRERHVVYRLSEKLCSGVNDSLNFQPRIATNHPCVNGSYYCPKYNITEVQCKKVSYGCFSSILMVGVPKCVESKFNIVTRMTPSGPIKIKYVTNCSCF